MSVESEKASLEKRVLVRSLVEIMQGYPSLTSELVILTHLVKAIENDKVQRLEQVVEDFMKSGCGSNPVH